MRFLNNLFRRTEESKQPEIQFGRFSDSFKEDKKYDAWDRSLEFFERKKYLESVKEFFEYLRDDSLDNVNYEVQEGKIVFELYQGSKKVTGYADAEILKAEAKIAVADNLDIGFLRKLMEENFQLRYTRYALDSDKNITMIFHTHIINASPYKLYYALKELATNADKQDDVLISEFDSLNEINTGHVREISEDEKNIKYQFLQTSIDKVFHEIDHGKLNILHYPGGVLYMYLDLAFKLDYLLKPEGYTMEKIDDINSIFHQNDQSGSGQNQNAAIRKIFKKIKAREEHKFNEELYDILSTFGMTIPSGHERLNELISGEISKMDWYYENGHDAIALSIPSFIAGFALYSYALPEADKAFLHLLIQILEADFFRKLGYCIKMEKNGKLIIPEIKRQINSITKVYKDRYPRMKPDLKMLKYEDPCIFAKTYLMMIKDLDLTKAQS